MTVLAGQPGMSTLQRECSEIVIELCRGPSIRGVTLAAIQPEASLVRFIGVMAGIAILRSHRKISQAACVDMALDTGDADMLTRKLEGKVIVVEVLIEAVHPVMAIEAG